MMQKVLTLVILALFMNLGLSYSQSKTYQLGDEFMGARMYDKAVEEFTKQLQGDKNDSYGYYKRGVAFLYLNNFDAAIADFTKALEISKDDADCYNNRGLALSYKGNLQEAMKDFDKAIKLDPAFAQAFINRGSAYIALNDYKKAKKDFGKAIKIDPQNPEIYLQRARLNYMTGDYKASIKDYSTTIAMGIGSSKVYYNRGNSYFKLEKYQEAINDYSMALELDPDELDALNNRAYTYKLLNKDNDAEADKTLLDQKRGDLYTPIEQLKFRKFTSKGGEISLELPEDWIIQDAPNNDENRTEFTIFPTNSAVNEDGLVVGVTIGILKNLSQSFPVTNETEILDFWKGSLDQSNEDMLIYKVEWQRHLQLFNHATILNRSLIQANENYMQFGLYEYAIAWGDNLIYLYYQAPEASFDAYYSDLFKKSYESIKIDNKAMGISEEK